MLYRSHLRRSLSRGLFGLFALLLLNGVVFRHAHRLADGRIITHAHPFWPDGKGPIKPNTHTPGELALLDDLANPLLTLSPAVTYCFAAGVIELRKGQSLTDVPLRSVAWGWHSLRGPPVGLLS